MTRENIEIEERIPVPPPPDIKHWQLIMAPVSKLFIDRRYQRGLVRSQVKRLVNEWDWDKYHPISIAHRADGRYAVIAGQQRTEAALELGIETLPAVLRVAQDIHTEAKQYLGSGNVATIQASDKFKARLVANEQKAFDIWNVVETCGFTLRAMQEGERGAYSDPFAIEAVAALEQIFDAGYLAKTLAVIHATWGGNPTKEMVHGSMLVGMYMAIRHLERHEVSYEELPAKLNKFSPKELMDKGVERYRSLVAFAKGIHTGVAAVVIDTFNLRRKEPVPPFSWIEHRAATVGAASRQRFAKMTPEKRKQQTAAAIAARPPIFKRNA